MKSQKYLFSRTKFRLPIRALFLSLLFCGGLNVFSQTPLAIITGFNEGGPDGVAIALVENLPAGTRIYLTTEEYDVDFYRFADQVTGNVDEFVGYWESPTEVPEGMVIAISEVAPNVFSVECNHSGWFTFGVDCGSFTRVSGDFDIDQVQQIYLYSDNDTDPGNGITRVHAAMSIDFTQANHSFPANLNPGTPTGNWPYAFWIDGLPKTANATKRFFNYQNSGRFTNKYRFEMSNPSYWDDSDSFLPYTKLDTARFLGLYMEYCLFTGDDDGDLICNPTNLPAYVYYPSPPDNCPNTINPDQADADNNGIGDVCEPCFQDNIPPIAVASNNFNASIQANGFTVDLNQAAFAVGSLSTDNCGIASYSITPKFFSCTDIGNPKVVLTVTDNAGNTDTAQVRINVFDGQAPTLSSLPSAIYLCEGESFSFPTPTASDNCGVPTVYCTRSDWLDMNDPFPVGTTTVSCYAEDPFGNNSGTQTTSISVWDSPDLSLTASQNIVYPGYAPEENTTLGSVVSGGSAPFSYLWSNGATSPSISVSPSTNTTYSLTITDANNCSASSSIDICAINVACGNGNNAKVEMCRNGKTKCVSINAVPAQLANGAQLGACGATANCASQPSSRTFSSSESIQLRAFPNPFSQHTTIEVLVAENTQAKIELFTLDGKRVKEMFTGELLATEANTFKIQSAGLSEGMYLLRLMTDSKIVYEKLMLK